MTMPAPAVPAEARSSWRPMLVIAMGQMLLSFNFIAIPVSMGGMVKSLDVPPTDIGTAIVMLSLGVSAFILLGARLGQRFGARLAFQIAVLCFGGAMVIVALSPSVSVLIAAQSLAGLSASALVPALVMLIAGHYRGQQRAEALGWVGSAGALASVLSFVIGGLADTFLTWRVTFGMLVVLAMIVFALSFLLKPVRGNPEVRIDLPGVVLSSVGIILLTLGFNNLLNRGTVLASSEAPFSVLGISPVPLVIVTGVVLTLAFLVWTHRIAEFGKTPLLSLVVVDSPMVWAAMVAIVSIGVIESAIYFAVPLYIQIVQGRSSMASSLAMMPLMLTVVFSAVLVVRLRSRFSPRQLASIAFLLVMAGAMWLAFVVRNDWSTIPVVAGLITIGMGQGALLTLLFSVLISSAPSELSGDVGSVRGVAQNLAAAMGTALMAALLVGILSILVSRELIGNPIISDEFKRSEIVGQFDLDSINFIGNDQLTERLQQTAATADQVQEAVRINTSCRLRALKLGFLVLACVALIAILPCYWLPGDMAAEPEQNPSPDEPAPGNRKRPDTPDDP